MGLAKITLTPELISTLMDFPFGTEIASIEESDDCKGHAVLIVSHADIPPSPVFWGPWTACPKYEETEGYPVFKDWGIVK